MRHKILNKFFLAAAMLGLGVGIAAADIVGPVSAPDAAIAKKLRHQIVMYPYYNIFDDIRFFVDGGRVELLGDVTQPFKKADLGRIAERVPGVTSVDNEIKVLPLSAMDNQLRWRVARAIFRDPMFTQYALQAVPPIHIIVDNGHVTLDGVVRTQTEKEVAGIRAASVGLSFGPITNNLRVEQPSPKS